MTQLQLKILKLLAENPDSSLTQIGIVRDLQLIAIPYTDLSALLSHGYISQTTDSPKTRYFITDNGKNELQERKARRTAKVVKSSL